MRIEVPDKQSFCLEVKRFYVPHRIFDDCPGCDAGEVESSETDGYFSYPSFGASEEVSFYCTSCYSEWSRYVRLSLLIEEDT